MEDNKVNEYHEPPKKLPKNKFKNNREFWGKDGYEEAMEIGREIEKRLKTKEEENKKEDGNLDEDSSDK